MSASSSRSDAKPLSGKVAVVTGASGGIGAGAFFPALEKGGASIIRAVQGASSSSAADRSSFPHPDADLWPPRVGFAAAAIARALASAGAKVALGARRLEALEDVKATIEATVGATGVVIIVKTDVTKREDVSGRAMRCASALLRGGGE